MHLPSPADGGGLETIGQWTTAAGNQLSVRARPGTKYASVWLDAAPESRRVAKVRRQGRWVRGIEWDELYRGQPVTWKAEQRKQIGEVLAVWLAPVMGSV